MSKLGFLLAGTHLVTSQSHLRHFCEATELGGRQHITFAQSIFKTPKKTYDWLLSELRYNRFASLFTGMMVDKTPRIMTVPKTIKKSDIFM